MTTRARTFKKSCPALNKTANIERVVSPENVTDIFQASKEAFDALVFYFSRLEMTGQSDKDSAVKLGKR